MPLVNQHKEYTYEDYLAWPEEERWEIIDGIAYQKDTPSPVHQKIIGNIYYQLHSYFQGKECTPFIAPFTVRLPLHKGETDERNNKNIVEPDLVVICDIGKLDEFGYYGAPKLVIEVVQKSSIKRDYLLKRKKYEKAGVEEYWIVTPEIEMIRVMF